MLRTRDMHIKGLESALIFPHLINQARISQSGLQPWAKERDTDRKNEAAAYAAVYLVLYQCNVMAKVSQDIHPFNSSSSKSNAAYTVKLLSISQMSPGPWGSAQELLGIKMCQEGLKQRVCVLLEGSVRTPKSSAGSLTRWNIRTHCIYFEKNVWRGMWTLTLSALRFCSEWKWRLGKCERCEAVR